MSTALGGSRSSGGCGRPKASGRSRWVTPATSGCTSPPSCSRSPARCSGMSRTASPSRSSPRCWRCLPAKPGRDGIASSCSGSTAPAGTPHRTWSCRRASGSPTCPRTPPSFSPPSTSGPFWMSRSRTATLRPSPIWNARSQTVAGSSTAISSASGQTSIGGPSQPPRAKQPEMVSLAKTAPRVGDWVVAIGNPFGLGGTVTAGIVSARGRDIGASAYDDFLQIDAPINKGNSGGPTFNLQGEVVGVNTAIFSPSGGSVGLAFAIPSETVQSVVNQLETEGQVTRGYLGAQIQPLSKDLAGSLGLSSQAGALVASAQDGTPAAKAGLKAGDVITAVNREPVANARELSRKIAGLKPGTRIELGYVRDGKPQTASVELGVLPNDKAARSDTFESSGPQLGLRLAPSDEGVEVVAVDPSSPAAAKGLEAGDVILEVGGQTVSKPADVRTGLEIAKKEGKKAVLFRVRSREGTRFVAIAMPQAG